MRTNILLRVDRQRFLSFLLSQGIRTDKGCLEWPFSRKSKKSQYGQVTFGGKQRLIHRVVAHIVYNMPLDSKLKALHECDNPRCYEPTHLKIGTQSENLKDAFKRGRRRVYWRHRDRNFDGTFA